MPVRKISNFCMPSAAKRLSNGSVRTFTLSRLWLLVLEPKSSNQLDLHSHSRVTNLFALTPT